MLTAARVILFVKDMDKMLAFYQNVLGLPRIDSADNSEDFISLDAGGISMSLHKIPPRFAKDIEITDPPAAREKTPVKVAFHADDVEQLRSNLEERGVRMLKLQKWDALCFCDGIDPEGNIFQISNRP